MTTSLTTTRKSLARGNVELPADALAARVFGELCDLAWPVVTNYRSDLYYDAKWLYERFDLRINDPDQPLGFPFSWIWSCREYGTQIGLIVEEERDIKFACEHNDHVWKCTVINMPPGSYDLVIETIK